MSYESLERELARRQSRRQSRRSKGDKKAKRNFNPYRRKGRKGNRTRTKLAEGEDKLGKALAAARERAKKFSKSRLNITKLPPRSQKTLQDFENFDVEYSADAEPQVGAEYPVKVVSYSVDVHKDDYEQGEIGDSVHYWRRDEGDFDFDTKAENQEELLNILNRMIRIEIEGKVPTHGKVDFGFEIDSIEGRIYTDVHATYEEGQGMGIYDYPQEYEKKAWKRGEQELFSLGFIFNIEPVDESYAENFNAESKDEAIVVEGHRPKRVETYTGTVALFYIGKEAERHYNHPRSLYQERTLLLPPIPNSIVNPTGITVEDVDEIMQHYTGAPWTGEYVLWSEDTGQLVESGRTRRYTFDSEEFRADPAVFIKCFECEKPGYSDEMTKIAFGYLCARCARPEIDWASYGAEYESLNHTHRDILTYLSQFNPELVHRKYGIPTGTTQREIGKAVGTVRTNATKHLQDLVKLGLVTQIMRRPDGARRIAKVYLPTYEGRKIAESFQAEDLNGNGVIDAWETHAHENTLTGLAHEETHSSETFRARGKSHLRPSEVREKAKEIMKNVNGWIWPQDLTSRINATLPPRKNVTQRFVSQTLGKSVGGKDGFYITRDGRIFYYGDKDRGEFIKGVI